MLTFSNDLYEDISSNWSVPKKKVLFSLSVLFQSVAEHVVLSISEYFVKLYNDVARSF